jgi:penicillin-binding protein 1B
MLWPDPGIPEPKSSNRTITARLREVRATSTRFVTRRRKLVVGCIVCLPVVVAAAVLIGSYLRYSRLIDTRLKDGPFHDSVNIYAAPLLVSAGDQLSADELLAELRGAGYQEARPSRPLTARSWRVHLDTIEISTPESQAPATIYFSKDQISRLVLKGKDVKQLPLGAPLITTLSSHDSKEAGKGPRHEERLIVTFHEIPPVLVQAVVSAEDKRFFSHGGLDMARALKAAYIDARDQRKEQGASTLTMQLVRGLWLAPEKRWERKIAEVMMTLHLEHEWSKEKIFETYVNQVYLGHQAAYSVHGFGEGSRLFFGKPLREINLSEAALLAGLVQRPSYFNPLRYPARAKDRRDLVLRMMMDNRYITSAQYDAAIHTPARIVGGSLNQARAPWFLDVVNSDLQNADDDDSIRSVYTTIDLNLQRAAEEAIASGMQEVDKITAKAKESGGKHAEAALIALDPHTGEIRALVGGRDYSRSQLNRALSMRPPGSVFKPFVYAAALNTAISGSENVYTPATTVDDTPMTFWFAGKAYQPNNFKDEVFGTLTLREALAHSDNVAAVKVAQGVGFNAVVQMAKRAGLNGNIGATPAVALGAYDVTPLEMAGAYTVFANGGAWVQPRPIVNYRDAHGGVVASARPLTHPALDPRVNWLIVSMLEEVMRSGTAAAVYSRGFNLPAAGKTGTAHDGWFAGFTSQLLCIVWVGFDDYRELNIEGAKSALPIWTDFMKRASRQSPYRNAKEFPMPRGIESAQICKTSGMLSSDKCPDTRSEFFIAGSEPAHCDMHQGQAAPEAIPTPDPSVTTVATRSAQ